MLRWRCACVLYRRSRDIAGTLSGRWPRITGLVVVEEGHDIRLPSRFWLTDCNGSWLLWRGDLLRRLWRRRRVHLLVGRRSTHWSSRNSWGRSRLQVTSTSNTLAKEWPHAWIASRLILLRMVLRWCSSSNFRWREWFRGFGSCVRLISGQHGSWC